MYKLLNMLTFPTASISLFPAAMETVVVAAKAKVSQTERENADALCFKTSRLCKPCQKCFLSYEKYAKYATYNYLTPPPARWLCTIMGPGCSSASTSSITRNKDAKFPPDRRMRSSKSKGGSGSTGGCGGRKGAIGWRSGAGSAASSGRS